MSDVPRLAIEVHTQRRQLLPRSPYVFPDPAPFDAQGVVARGGDFEPATIIAAYEAGVFPWPHPQEEYLWCSPDPRCVFEVDGLHVPRRLARTIRARCPRVTIDAAFADVVEGCADRDDTWITPALIDGYRQLHELGWAHSVEVWAEDGTLAGGLYGVAVGAMFGAESMFHRRTDASKIALVALMQHCRAIGVEFVDIQVETPHTHRLGARSIPRSLYLRRLRRALSHRVDWAAAK